MPESLTSLNARTLQACESGDIDAMKQIVELQNVQEWDVCAHLQAMEYMKSVHPYQLPYSRTMLEAAVRGRHLPMIRYLLATFPEVKISPAAIRASIYNYPSIPVFQLLLNHDRSIIDYEFRFEGNALLLACRDRRDEFAMYLLDNGANPNINAVQPWSTLYYALDNEALNLDLVKRLIERGANLHDRLALEHAVDRGHCDAIVAFIDAGLDIEFTGIGVETGRGTLLHCAVRNCQTEISRLLLQHGADPHAMDEGGDTVLQFAMGSTSEEIVYLFSSFAK